MIESLLLNAKLVDHSLNPCENSDLIPNESNVLHHDSSTHWSPNSTLAMYIQMSNARDFTTWLQVAKCLKIWDLDARGYHNSMWRFFVNGRHMVVVGVPNSPYSRYMPSSVVPISLDASQTKPV